MNTARTTDSPEYRAESDDSLIAQALRILDQRIKAGPELGSPGAVRDYLTLHAARHNAAGYEVFSVLFLDSQHRVIELREMFKGTVSQTSVYPREIARAALLLNATAVILTHNHPSGSTKPSRADEAITEVIKTALALLDVRVLDHIITAGGTSLSMAEQGLM